VGGSPDEKKLRRTLRRFFVSKRRIHKEVDLLLADLDQDVSHHIRTVLRIGTGAKIILFDGTGREYLSEIVASTPNRVKVKILEQSFPDTESALKITLGQAILKEQAFDHVLTAATELGVFKIVPMLSKRVVVKISAGEIEKKMYRWRKILEEASAQSGRVVQPEISYPTGLDAMLKENHEGLKIILWEKAKGGELKSLPQSQAPENVTVLIGPEGGFEDEEAQTAIGAGFLPVGLGPRILRAETAPIAGISILQHLFGDLS
jgi:16S rRNA (uracil1498-N3)-methyltransferase